MSVKISGTTITMTRGDTLRLGIEVNDGNGNVYTPVEGDVVRFALKKEYDESDCLICKEIPINTMELHLAPEDTHVLDQVETYVYEVSITLNNGDVDTFISGKLKTTGEVHK
jgi:hypothetical protein